LCASGERHLQSERGLWEDRPGSRLDLFAKLLPHDHAELGRLADASGRGAQWPRASLGEDRLGAQGRSGLCGIAGPAQRLPSVRQQFFDPPRGMGADSIEHIAEVSLRIDLQLFARHAQAH